MSFVACRQSREGDASGAKSARGVPWQRTSAETAEGELVNAACVAGLERSWNRERGQSSLVLCQARGEARKVWILQDYEGCRVAASGDEVFRPHGKEWRERITVDTVCAATRAQNRLRAAGGLVPAASAARAEVAQEGQASPKGCSQGVSKRRDD